MSHYDVLSELTSLIKVDVNILSAAFKEQKAFIEDKARLKALFCTRRAAKSFTAGLYLIKTAMDFPGVNCLFLGLTRMSAAGIVWKDILKAINIQYDLGIVFNETNLTATLPNGSVIWVTGCDTSEDEMNKLLGKKYKLVILDEASMYTINLNQLIYGVLKPATADYRGTICMMGTSSNITRGLFYDITIKKEAGWSLHTWTAHDNPYVAIQWQEELDDIAINRPLFMNTALFKQWYLNQWVVDEDAKVYKFNSLINTAACLPIELQNWHYILGVDLAHSPDSTAFVVGAYHEACPNLYLVYANKHLKMDITDASTEVRRLDKNFGFDVKVVDGANKMAVAEMNQRHLTGLIPADKTGKVDFINIMNAEFIQGHIKVLPGASSIIEEYETLVWVTDNGIVIEPKKEHPGIHNDMADSALYLWRYAYTYLWKPIEKFSEPGTLESWEPEHIKKLQDQIRREQNPNGLDELEVDPPNEFSEDEFEQQWKQM